jgi:hypothetical protein
MRAQERTRSPSTRVELPELKTESPALHCLDVPTGLCIQRRSRTATLRRTKAFWILGARTRPECSKLLDSVRIFC